MSVLNMHIQAAIPNAALFRSDISDELSRVLTRMLQKDPRDRFATPADVADSLLPLTLSDHPIPRRPRSSDPGVVPVLASDNGDGLSIDAGAFSIERNARAVVGWQSSSARRRETFFVPRTGKPLRIATQRKERRGWRAEAQRAQLNDQMLTVLKRFSASSA